jgi:hypothetical protein
MTDSRNTLSCQEFQAQLPALIGTGDDIADHPHFESCELCRALLADLEARQLFPVEEPPDEVWEHIELALKDEESS